MPAPGLLPLIPPPVRRLFRRVFPHRPPDFAGLWRSACQKWVVGSAGVQDGHLLVHGWLAAPPDVRPHVGYRVNGERFEQVSYPLPRPDVAVRHPYADAAESGFILTRPLPPGVADPGDLELTPVDERTGRPLGEDYRPVSVPSAARLGPVPPDRRVARVIGEPSAFSFAMGGYTAFRRLEETVWDLTGEPLSAYPRVLDWGCGCGRVSRYFLAVPGCTVTGADVDPDNVGWCRANLPAGRWAVVPLRPPTDLPTGSFDLAFGVSVFTHLQESDQRAWLHELHRLLRPGGLALMTYHGEASLVWAKLSAERYTALRRRGIVDQPNPLYDAELTEDDYYRDTFHSERYVRRVWGRYFDILAVRPCEIAHQDLVVMRR